MGCLVAISCVSVAVSIINDSRASILANQGALYPSQPYCNSASLFTPEVVIHMAYAIDHLQTLSNFACMQIGPHDSIGPSKMTADQLLL